MAVLTFSPYGREANGRKCQPCHFPHRRYFCHRWKVLKRRAWVYTQYMHTHVRRSTHVCAPTQAQENFIDRDFFTFYDDPDLWLCTRSTKPERAVACEWCLASNGNTQRTRQSWNIERLFLCLCFFFFIKLFLCLNIKLGFYERVWPEVSLGHESFGRVKSI